MPFFCLYPFAFGEGVRQSEGDHPYAPSYPKGVILAASPKAKGLIRRQSEGEGVIAEGEGVRQSEGDHPYAPSYPKGVILAWLSFGKRKPQAKVQVRFPVAFGYASSRLWKRERSFR